jgi:hypothetical protein
MDLGMLFRLDLKPPKFLDSPDMTFSLFFYGLLGYGKSKLAINFSMLGIFETGFE